jgi:hypothetical protein
MTKTSVSNYKEIVENTKQQIMRYIGTRFVDSVDVGLPSITLNCNLSNEDKEAISKNIFNAQIMLVLFVESDSELRFGETIKI